ncbi:C-factor-like isoform X3 [Tyto alba]|uniref:C-factor-like isoform X3 n=1 Tax=Tyto alba TaxID=56313 RepID=UPI001C671BF5|nr:C-factor-like isoform X3 [Tyto alba]
MVLDPPCSGDWGQPGNRPGACLASPGDAKATQVGVCDLSGPQGTASAEVTDPASIQAAAARVGEHLGGSGLNLLINNAGMAKVSSLDTETPENMIHVYTTNMVGPLLLGQAFLPLLKKAAQGSLGSALSCSKAAIINMSSSAGSIEEIYLWNHGQVVSYRCSKPPTTVDTSVQGMLKVLSSLSEKDTGTLLDWEGKVVPW